VIKELGQFEQEPVALATGRYGFYLRFGKQNIALPNEYKKDEEKAGALTMDEAVAIIRAKRAKD
jgi:DNA topoisomerase-1